MLHLPYLPPPYPDELLGSWLSRISLHNGKGAWRTLVDSTGYASQIERPHFDLVDHNDNFERLLNALGTTYERAIMELTTLPYWLTFDSDSSNDAFLAGTNNVPRIFRMGGQKDIRSICFLGIDRKAGKSLRPRFCPQCLERDFNVYGEPYWHRSHQLPNVFFCHEHHNPLQTSCPKCKRDIVAISKRLIDLPRLKCPCGYDLYFLKPTSPPPDKFAQLIDVSVRALNHAKFGWHHEDVRTYLRSILEKSQKSLAESYKASLSAVFQIEQNSNSKLFSSKIHIPGEKHQLMQLRNTFRKIKAPECCALLVASGICFEHAQKEFLNIASNEKKRNIRSVFLSKNISVDSARLELLRKVKQFPHRQPSDHRKLYWFLRLHDSQWLKQQFPETLKRRISSVEIDRKIITKHFSDIHFPPAIRRTKVVQTAAWIRAILRDQKWLMDQLDRLLHDNRMKLENDRQDILQQRSSDISNAIQILLQKDNIPKRILASTLASETGLTQYQVSTTIAKFPQIRKTISDANKDFNRRKVLWAVRQQEAEGYPLTVSSILSRAGLSDKTPNATLVRKILETLNN